tara:strand:+ start:697 stop:954 length:258 start_codon:yes stop_codon:yes gene_type:complete
MFNNSIKILYFILISLFLYLILSTYFSKDNILKNSDISKKINIILSDKSKDLKILKNDTNNVIIYNSENVTNDRIKKRKIWELLK